MSDETIIGAVTPNADVNALEYLNRLNDTDFKVELNETKDMATIDAVNANKSISLCNVLAVNGQVTINFDKMPLDKTKRLLQAWHGMIREDAMTLELKIPKKEVLASKPVVKITKGKPVQNAIERANQLKDEVAYSDAPFMAKLYLKYCCKSKELDDSVFFHAYVMYAQVVEERYCPEEQYRVTPEIRETFRKLQAEHCST